MKKSIVIGIIVMIAVAISIYLQTAPEELGNMGDSYAEQTTTTSAISFPGEAGDKIKFSFRSTVKSGDLDMILCDSAGNEVYKLDKAKALETFFSLSNSDTYTLAAECKDFIGEFTIKVYKIK
ncbi:MAG TPA: hypothetical protein DEB31_11750 [Clostridiales bacterium]|nr:hypothetical protein [Clostridiales bacterium]